LISTNSTGTGESIVNSSGVLPPLTSSSFIIAYSTGTSFS
jgi:hypothetical protein